MDKGDAITIYELEFIQGKPAYKRIKEYGTFVTFGVDNYQGGNYTTVIYIDKEGFVKATSVETVQVQSYATQES